MKPNGHLLLVALVAWGCQGNINETDSKETYSHDIGDIPFDRTVDDPSFKLCDSTKIVTRRKALAYKGDRSKIVSACLKRFTFKPEFESFNGYVTIRFIVNCQNQAGRFRAESLDWNFSHKACPESLKKHVIEIIQNLEGWSHAYSQDTHLDLVKFINFKIVNGRIENVLQ
ncbi:MAG: hypothetical protein AAGF85_09360 [Bacteroidota bacterium]